MIKLVLLLSCLLLAGCDDQAWNDPYPNQSSTANIIYAAFTEQPKHLDPAISYSADEWQFIGQIYEPVLEYNYLLRPYQLQPLIATKMPQVSYDPKTDITTYLITIKPQINYQPHPAFAKDLSGQYWYHNLTKSQAKSYKNIKEFIHTDSRELLAADYAYQIKRLADPTLNSPVFGFLSPYIIGLNELRQTLSAAYAANPDKICLDLRDYDFPGVEVIDDYTYAIKIQGKYAQFKYWLEMPFFSPIPWEASKFYCQAGMQDHNLSLDTYPIGTGPFYLNENNPERRMLLQRNPNFHADFYPTVGMPEDKANGLLANAGKQIPFVDQILFSLEKEDIPYWDKFLQGYYDRSGITSNNFNSAISQASRSSIELSKSLMDKGIKISVSNTLTTFYWGFNMLDETIGGTSERARKLRKAISLAFDTEEFITIFSNGRAVLANGPIPPGIEGYTAADVKNTNASLPYAKQLLAEAGYPEGRDRNTGKSLQIFFDAISSGDPSEHARVGWVTKQFNKLGIDLVVRATDYNRFQDKLRNGSLQFFFFGWSADYPDPENFLFLFYGPNGRVKYDGENAINYSNPNFDKLFAQFKTLGDDPKRGLLIQQMIDILKEDVPWIWGFFPQSYILSNAWYSPTKPSNVSMNTAKYSQVDPIMREKLRLAWNKPLIWPFVVVLTVIIVILAPAYIGYMRSKNAKARRMD